MTIDDENKNTKIDSKTSAILIIDPQNDFLSQGGAVWDLVGDQVKKNDVVNKLKKIKEIAKESGITVFYSPHYYTEEEYKNWTHINFVDKVMFDRKMFLRGSWGSEFHPDLQPDDNTIVLSPHKGLSNFQTGDINVQLRQRNIKTLIIAGMSANLCVESHVRDAAEHAFDTIVVKDATAGPGDKATEAAIVNFGFLASEVLTTEELFTRIK